MKPKTPSSVILRIDDIDTTTTPGELRRVYEPCWARDIPACLSITPAPGEGDVRENGSLVAFLDRLWRDGLVELLLHGWQHAYGELASGSTDQIRARIEAGLAVLRGAWPGIPIRVLVPPHEHLSLAGLEAARQLSLDVCTTWAASRGGTRWAHWRARLRRWAGWPLAPAGRGLWPTDVRLLDFRGPERADRPVTERVLRLGKRWSTPVVFVQHYRRLLESRRLEERWFDWLTWMAAWPDVQFVRFCDAR
jgi:hypothetical protein